MAGGSGAAAAALARLLRVYLGINLDGESLRKWWRRLFNYFKAFLALKLYLGPVLACCAASRVRSAAFNFARGSSEARDVGDGRRAIGSTSLIHCKCSHLS